MHGLVNRSIQQYVCHIYGTSAWRDVTRKAGIGFTEFEGMLRYKETYTPLILDAASEVLNRPRADVMEDIGAFLVCHPGFEAVRRLLRFGGEDFVEFLHSLDDLHDRVRLAVSDLYLPNVELRGNVDGHFSLTCDAKLAGYGHFMIGVLRAMADEYGALALLEHKGAAQGIEVISISLVENDFAEGRAFDLGARVG